LPIASAADREAFRRAAEDAVSRVPCWGEGAVYRAVASLQRAFFDPPPDGRAHWDIEQQLPGTRQVLSSVTKHAMRRSADEIGATSISFRPKVFSDPASVVD
jgi:hypothetical protein